MNSTPTLEQHEGQTINTTGFNTLTELPGYLRKTLPDPKFITAIEVREEIGAVMFRWHGIQFLVERSLRVLEVRERKLYISNLSTLLQAILARRMTKQLLLAGAIESLSEAEKCITIDNHPRQGVDLVEAVKRDLKKAID
ncbi:MAG: hypothetical protein EXS23_05780 [Pedosphaera sp.]|nr:hypothetical protein [Pedosphaera sp.]